MAAKGCSGRGQRRRPTLGAAATCTPAMNEWVGEALRGTEETMVVLERREQAWFAGIEVDRDGGHGGHWGARELLEPMGGVGED